MKRECCICHCSLGPDIPDPIRWDRKTMGEPVSSGYCDACLNEAMDLWDKEREKLKKDYKGPIIW